jgi:hypothetical protein
MKCCNHTFIKKSCPCHNCSGNECDYAKERKQALRHNIRYADIKIGDWKVGLQRKLEDRGVLDWNAVDMIEMYSEWKGAWKAELTNL